MRSWKRAFGRASGDKLLPHQLAHRSSSVPEVRARTRRSVASVWWPALALVGLQSLPVRADVSVELAPGVTCLQGALLQERITGWLHGTAPMAGSDGAVESPSEARLEVRGSAHDPRSVLVVLHQADGSARTRSFSPGPERCADLHEAVALAAALLIRAASGLTAEPSEALREPSKSAPPPEALPRSEPQPSRRELAPVQVVAPPAPLRMEGELALGAALATQVGAGLSGGGRAQLGLRVLPRLDLRLGGLLLAARSEPLATGGGFYALRIAAAATEGCARWLSSSAVIARFCAGVSVGRQRVSGSGYQPNLTSQLRWLSLTGGPELALAAAGNLWISLAGALVVPLESTEVVLVDVAGERLAASSSPALGLALFLGISYRIAPAEPKSVTRIKDFGPAPPE